MQCDFTLRCLMFRQGRIIQHLHFICICYTCWPPGFQSAIRHGIHRGVPTEGRLLS